MRKFFLISWLILSICNDYLFAQAIITTIAGSGLSQFIGNGYPATNYSFFYPNSICVDRAGNIYVSDYGNMMIRKLDRFNNLSTTVGDTLSGYSGDGGQASAALLHFPDGICIDTAGNIYITEQYNDVVREVTASTGIINTVCGSGTGGFGGDGFLATTAHLEQPGSACVDKLGNIYIPDYGNHRIRKVDADTHIITTYAGTGTPGYSGDGGYANNAKLNYPYYTCTDNNDNVYFSELGNNTVRKIDHNSGIITTVAGTGIYGYTGDNGPAINALLNQPYGVFVDKWNNILIADNYNEVIRQVDNFGIITTIAGNGHNGYTGDGGPATDAKLNSPMAICVDDSGFMYIADGLNAVIRKVSNLVLGTKQITETKFNVYPNPTQGVFSIRFSEKDKMSIAQIEVFNTTSQCVYKSTIYNTSNDFLVNLEGYPKGVYFLRISTNYSTKVESVILQ